MVLRLITRIIAACALGLVLSLWIIQNNSSVQDLVGNYVVQFIETEWKTKVTVEKPRINFFTCSIYLDKGTITPTDAKKYHWSFEQCCLHVSPLKLILKRKAALYLEFNNVKAFTQHTSTTTDIVEHIKDMFKTRSDAIAIAPKAITIHNADCTVAWGDQLYNCKLPADFTITKEKSPTRTANSSWYGSLDVTGALITVNNQPLAHSATGITKFWLDKQTKAWHYSSTIQTKLPVLNPQAVFTLTGSLDGNHGQLTCSDSTGKTKLATSYSLPLTVGIKGQIPVGHIHALTTLFGASQLPSSPITGTCTVDAVLVPHDQQLSAHGNLELQDVVFGSVPLQKISLALGNSQAGIELQQSSNYSLAGTCNWDLVKQSISLTLTNTRQLAMPLPADSAATSYHVLPGCAHVGLTYQADGVCKGTYNCKIQHPSYEQPQQWKGCFAVKNSQLGLRGSTTKGSYEIKAAFKPHPHITALNYTHHGRPIVACHTHPSSPLFLAGAIEWGFIKQFLNKQTRHMIFGNNSVFDVALDQSSPDNLIAHVKLARGSFYMPEYHNLIQNISASVQVKPSQRQIIVDNLRVVLSKGLAICQRASIRFDDAWNVHELHAPLCLNNLFVNWKNDFYGFVYGNLALTKQPGQMTQLAGTLVLKKSLLRDAFLRGESKQELYGPLGAAAPHLPFPLGLDVKLVTQQPIRVSTGTVNALANIDIALTGKAQHELFSVPVLSGSIKLESGTVKILHKDLRIISGKIQFLHNNINDPLIDLVARNRIGKYNVTLQVTNSLHKPSIILESTPELSEEQIISLLLTGSEGSSLQADLPSMLIQNLDTLLFSSRREGGKGQALVDTLTKTLKYIQLTPNLDTGALKASLTLPITDQLRIKAGKDNVLDMQQDFSAQAEYLLSDNINLRFIQEQQGERGVEVELRLKP